MWCFAHRWLIKLTINSLNNRLIAFHIPKQVKVTICHKNGTHILAAQYQLII
ncbi:hypothetical protein D024_3833 [Vibrio parahaemolyticus 3259]|nr:hypothetical protein FORC71_3565 [Vibrio parahaemolyticus]EQM15854.1 hypothetical protein D024_3833 [Vibrio parahaemolyticus 3259]